MRVERLRSAFLIDVAYRQYPLHPDTPDEGLTLEQLFAGLQFDIPAAQARIAGLMAKEGLPYGRRTMTYNSRRAQELAKWADTQPGGERIHGALFRAYFVDNVNLAKVEHLVSIAQQVGLPAEEARRVLKSGRMSAAVDADWERTQELVVTGVPTFLIGEHRLEGAQSYRNLEALVVAAGASRRNSD